MWVGTGTGTARYSPKADDEKVGGEVEGMINAERVDGEEDMGGPSECGSVFVPVPVPVSVGKGTDPDPVGVEGGR